MVDELLTISYQYNKSTSSEQSPFKKKEIESKRSEQLHIENPKELFSNIPVFCIVFHNQ